MKRFLVILALCVVGVHAQAQSERWRQGVSVLEPGVSVLLPTRGYVLIPFVDLETQKIGFLSSTSSLTVSIPPIYDDGFISSYLLMPVRKGEKWGVMDLGARFKREGLSFRDPIVPCIYERIEVVDDKRVKVWENGVGRVLDVSGYANL